MCISKTLVTHTHKSQPQVVNGYTQKHTQEISPTWNWTQSHTSAMTYRVTLLLRSFCTFGACTLKTVLITSVLLVSLQKSLYTWDF